MPVPESTQFTDAGSIKRYFGRLVGERFSGFIDFDFAGKKRRLFFDDGAVFSAQSAVAGETLADQVGISEATKQKAFALVRERKIAVEQALVESGVSEPQVLQALGQLCIAIVRACLAETTGNAKATEKAGLRTRMKGVPQNLLDMLTEPIIEKEDPVRAEINATYNALQGKDPYGILGVEKDAAPEQIKKRYFDLAKKWHTDNFAKANLGPTRAQLDQLFAWISDAYGLLSDPAKKQEYDMVQDRKARGLPTDVKDIMLAETMFHRGQALLKRNEFAAALKEMSEAKTINPGEGEFWVGYGLALYLAQPDQAKDAIAAVQKGIELQPKQAGGFEALGRIYRALGENVKAKSNFEKCLAIDPKNIAAQREIRLLNMRKESAKHAPIEQTGFFSKLFKK